jgi:signal peptidase II
MAKNRFSSGSAGVAPWLGIAAIVILIDQLSKIVISRMLTQSDAIPLNSFFNLVLAYNKGAAFSFLATQAGWQRWLFSGISLVATLFIIYLLKKHAGQKLFCWSMALILGGAVGNLIDRVIYGHVVDFVDFHIHSWHFPAFNVADSAICVGAVLFVIDELRRVSR